jgi:CheY-like chemotaxis protein
MAMFDNHPLTNDAPKKTILLAEDDSSVRRFIEVILQRANYDVLPAEDGLSAMQIALENDIHAIVADAIMPNLTGYDLCRLIRENPDFRQIPFIILSGIDHETENHMADAYLLKGNDLNKRLLSTLASVLAEKPSLNN